MEKTDTWETRRQKLTAILLEEGELFDLRFLMKVRMDGEAPAGENIKYYGRMNT